MKTIISRNRKLRMTCGDVKCNIAVSSIRGNYGGLHFNDKDDGGNKIISNWEQYLHRHNSIFIAFLKHVHKIKGTIHYHMDGVIYAYANNDGSLLSYTGPHPEADLICKELNGSLFYSIDTKGIVKEFTPPDFTTPMAFKMHVEKLGYKLCNTTYKLILCDYQLYINE